MPPVLSVYALPVEYHSCLRARHVTDSHSRTGYNQDILVQVGHFIFRDTKTRLIFLLVIMVQKQMLLPAGFQSKNKRIRSITVGRYFACKERTYIRMEPT